MKYTKSEELNILHETPKEIKLKNYFKSLSNFGEDFASRSIIIKGDMINSMKLFSTEDIAGTSEEIAIIMIKNSLLTYNHSKAVTLIKKLMLKDMPLETIIDFILTCKKTRFELAKNVYYQRESNPVNQFNMLYRDENDKTKEKVLDCITRLNDYLESKKENIERENNQEASPIKRYVMSPIQVQGQLKKIA